MKLKRWTALTMGEEGSTMPGELSGGMRRRVALDRALAHCMIGQTENEVQNRRLLMDEPFSGLDGPLKSRLIARICALKIPALVITHDPEEIRQMTDWVIFLNGLPLRILSEEERSQ
ncbi:MAG: hypothetical protein IIY71_04455 [Oscillospiraceae bacterium]|nr:hypothetical protein [Oscillospiraceae bacterium]